jgi:hypothetical protein
MAQPIIRAGVFTFQYGDVELVVAEHTLSSSNAPFTIFAPADDLNAVQDTGLLEAFRARFFLLEELLPKSIPMLRAYATLIMFYRISKNAEMSLTYEQAKAQLMGENAEDTLLFIVAKLLRHDDAELRRYIQQPHILASSLLKVKREFIAGEGNIVKLFQEARVESERKDTGRLSIKEFATLYQRLTGSPTSEEDKSEEKKGGEEKEAEDDGAVQTRARSAASSLSSSPSKPSAPVYRSSSSSRKRPKAKVDAGCTQCHLNDRPADLMICDRADCEGTCHFDCTVPPLSHVPEGSWFCATCKPLVRQALAEEESLLVRPVHDKDEKQSEEDADEDNLDLVEEISAERWRQAQERWRRDREQYKKELAEKDVEVERLRAEVESFKRQRVEEERKQGPVQEEPVKRTQRTAATRRGGRAK